MPQINADFLLFVEATRLRSKELAPGFALGCWLGLLVLGPIHFTYHADIARFLGEFLFQRGAVVKLETARLMTSNHNTAGQTPRGLGLNVGKGAGSAGCSEKTFGHTGSTGTIAWADPATETICVVLTSLPARAVTPHPRDLAADKISVAELK